MKLSIIIPCYKVEKYIDKCLESVTRYKTNNIEIILVDDGSPDNTPQICDSWAERDTRIKVIHQKNGGLSVARNNGLEASCGDYVWFVDSDDWVVDDAVQRVLGLINQNIDIEVFIMPLLWAYEGRQKDWTDINIKENMLLTGQQCERQFPISAGASVRNIIKRELLDAYDIRFYPNIVHEDGLFGRMLLLMAERVLLLSDYLYCYRQREYSIMHTITIKSAYSHITVHQVFMDFINNNIPQEKQAFYRCQGIDLLINAINFVWQLRHTSEFKEFMDSTKSYRMAESLKCIKNMCFVNKVRVILYAYCPMTYLHIIRAVKRLSYFPKALVKKSLVLFRT